MVYITSDIHGAFDIHKINPREFIPGQTMTEDDYLIICGDFGCIWDGGSSDQFWLNWFESLPWTTLFIDGNHENFDVLARYPVVDWNKGKARQIRSNVFMLMRGERYEFAGKSWLALGGGFSHDRSLRKKGVNWWDEEIFSREEAEHAYATMAKHDWKVDVVLSHDVFSAHPLAKKYSPDMANYSSDRVQQNEFLEQMRKKLDYRIWFAGHYHVDRLDYFDDKPCVVLFDTVEEVDNLIEKANNHQELC